jgi:hypothetical protein
MNYKALAAICIGIIALTQLIAIADAQATASCNLYINSTNSLIAMPGACQSYSVHFSKLASNSKLLCPPVGSSISAVDFGSGTYNNSIANCTFANAVITSMGGAQNNLIGDFGKYRLNFSGNDSNIALGYYFTFVPLNYYGMVEYEGFASVVPYSIREWGGIGIDLQNANNQLYQALAMQHNYTLPRFGDYPPTNSSGNITFALESKLIESNGSVVNYNPYWFVVPYWGHDILSFRKFNITSDIRYTPTYLAPYNESEQIEVPDNTDVYWNLTIKKYSNSNPNTLTFYDGYQGDPNNMIMEILHNVTNGTVRYNRGVESPGIHEFIGVLRAPLIGEQDNSTTYTYSVGISYCTYTKPPIEIPGYYSMVYKYLGALDVFWPTNTTCPVGLTVYDSNTIINCRGGTINSTNASVQFINSNNVELENCNVYGNALQLVNSNSIFINNTRLVANNATNTAIDASGSSVYLNNVSIVGYSKPSLLSDTTIKNGTLSVVPPQPAAIVTSTIQNAATSTQSTVAPLQPPILLIYYITALFLSILGLAAALYLLASQEIEKRQ